MGHDIKLSCGIGNRLHSFPDSAGACCGFLYVCVKGSDCSLELFKGGYQQRKIFSVNAVGGRAEAYYLGKDILNDTRHGSGLLIGLVDAVKACIDVLDIRKKLCCKAAYLSAISEALLLSA